MLDRTPAASENLRASEPSAAVSRSSSCWSVITMHRHSDLVCLLPAVQSAAPRRRERNSVHQQPGSRIGLAVMGPRGELPEFLPSNGLGLGLGWAIRTGGYDRRQPGGWIYNVLPFLGAAGPLHDLGSNQPVAAKEDPWPPR